MTILRRAVGIAVLALIFAPQSAFPVGYVDPSRLKAADSEPQNWVTVGRDQNQTYYSALAKINAGNVSRLGYYQTTPGDHWDFDACQKLVLADLKIGNV